jgi:acyl-coenzyme A thioesterase PaaI-like protein
MLRCAFLDTTQQAFGEQCMPANLSQVADFIAREFPQSQCCVEAVGDRAARVSRDIGEAELRPGGTVSGPVMMAVADVALYVVILGEIGIVPLTVTTSLTINFLRRPSAQARMVGECRLLKVGRSLAVGEVWLYSEGGDEPVAHVTGTYSIPSDRG